MHTASQPDTHHKTQSTPPPASESGETFRLFAQHVSALAGTRYAFGIAILIVLAWIVSGPFFDYSERWQLYINTFTTIMTFLMVFIIQNTQNREAKATQIKLDELLYAIKNARNALIDIEEAPDARLESLEQEFKKLRQHTEERAERERVQFKQK